MEFNGLEYTTHPGRWMTTDGRISVNWNSWQRQWNIKAMSFADQQSLYAVGFVDIVEGGLRSVIHTAHSILGSSTSLTRLGFTMYSVPSLGLTIVRDPSPPSDKPHWHIASHRTIPSSADEEEREYLYQLYLGLIGASYQTRRDCLGYRSSRYIQTAPTRRSRVFVA